MMSEGEEEFSDVPVCLQGGRMMGSQGGHGRPWLETSSGPRLRIRCGALYP